MTDPSFDIRIYPPGDTTVVVLVDVNVGLMAWVDPEGGDSPEDAFALQLTHEPADSDETVTMDYMMTPKAASAVCGLILQELGRQGRLDPQMGLKLMATIAEGTR